MKRKVINKSFFSVLIILMFCTYLGVKTGAQELLSYPVSYITPVEGNSSKRDTTSYIYRNEKIHNGDVVAKFYEASLSNNKKLIAYIVKNNNNWGVEPNIYISDASSGKILKQIPLVISQQDKFVSSWSPDNKYILVITKAQSVGEMKTELYDIEKGEIVENFTMFDMNYTWSKQNELIYIETPRVCESCRPTELKVTKFDANGRNKTELKNIFIDNNKEPKVNNIGVTDKTLNIDLSLTSSVNSKELKNLTTEENQVFDLNL